MKLKFGDFLENGYVRSGLLDGEARVIAKILKNENITTHQVRRFYDEVKHYKAKLDKGENFKKVKPLIVMLKSKAKYAATKKKEMNVFYEFIEQSIDKIMKAKDLDQKKQFDAFCLFFEAVYGFAELKN
jgi:CRISPR-associated protein Csm2